jgi:hypothetical protein
MLANSIDEAASVGEAVHAFDTSPEAAWSGYRMYLPGDPPVSLPTAAAGTAASGSLNRHVAEHPQSEWKPRDLEFMREDNSTSGARR